jgi:hypothetical protein
MAATQKSRPAAFDRKHQWSVLVMATLVLLLMAPVTDASATGARSPGLRHCRDLTVGSLDVVSIRANYGCRSARRNLKRLLRGGIGALPARKSSRGRWSCRKQGRTRICKRSRRGTFTLRIVFRTPSPDPTVVKPNSQPPAPPPAPPPPAPVPPPSPTPAPQDCLDLWNPYTSHAFQDDGYHFYVDHGVRKGWVFHMTDGTDRCAVIFVVPSFDYEYGTDGETVNKTGTGWILMNHSDAFGDQAFNIQKQAYDRANVSLNSLGAIAAL